MNSFRHIFIALLCLLAASNVAQAQNDWDSVLDRYEAITARCVELRAKVAAGEKVPQKSVTELFGELNRLRNSLQQASGKMSRAQKERFEAIRALYDGKMAGQAGHDEALRLRSGPGDSRSGPGESREPVGERSRTTAGEQSPVGERSRTTGSNMIEPLPRLEARPAMTEILRSAQNDSLSRNDTPVILNGAAGAVKDLPRAAGAVKDLQAGTIRTTGTIAGKRLIFNAIPTLSLGDTRQGGIFISMSRGRFGGYLSARTNFVSQLFAYECLSDGMTFGPETFKGNGGQRIGEYSLSAGAVINAAPWLGVFAGAGFGSSTLCWSDFRGTWAKVRDYSGSGLQIEGGIILRYRRLSLLGGVSWLTARPSSGPFMPVFTLGAGFQF